jgi:hypothetical protein
LGGVEASFFGASRGVVVLDEAEVLFFGAALRHRPIQAKQRAWGQSAVKAVVATGRGKPLRAQTPWTDLARNKARRTGAEQDVNSLRKPEDGAQPGEATLVLVAAFVLRRRRGRNPKGARFAIGITFESSPSWPRRARPIFGSCELERDEERALTEAPSTGRRPAKGLFGVQRRPVRPAKRLQSC